MSDTEGDEPMNDRLPIMTRVWHRAYSGWYDNDRAGRTLRAAVWGWISDRLANLAGG